MEEFFINTFGSFALWILPIFSGIVMSFLVEAVDYLTPKKLRSRWLLLLFSILVGVGLIFGFPIIVASLFDKIAVAFLNVIVALVFYKLFGKVIVQRLMNFALGRITNKFDIK